MPQYKNTNTNYANIFKRFYAGDSLAYGCFVTILALCGAININITERDVDNKMEHDRMKKFLSETMMLLDSNRKRFIRYYLLAVKIWMNEVSHSEEEATTVRQNMSILSKKANFDSMFRTLCMEADLSERLAKEE